MSDRSTITSKQKAFVSGSLKPYYTEVEMGSSEHHRVLIADAIVGHIFNPDEVEFVVDYLSGSSDDELKKEYPTVVGDTTLMSRLAATIGKSALDLVLPTLDKREDYRIKTERTVDHPAIRDVVISAFESEVISENYAKSLLAYFGQVDTTNVDPAALAKLLNGTRARLKQDSMYSLDYLIVKNDNLTKIIALLFMDPDNKLISNPKLLPFQKVEQIFKTENPLLSPEEIRAHIEMHVARFLETLYSGADRSTASLL